MSSNLGAILNEDELIVIEHIGIAHFLSLGNAHEQVASNGGRSIGLVRHSLNSLVSSLAVEQHTNIGWNVAERLYSSLVATDVCYDIGSNTLGQCQVLVTIPGSPVTTLGKYHTLEEDGIYMNLIVSWVKLNCAIVLSHNACDVIIHSEIGGMGYIGEVCATCNSILICIGDSEVLIVRFAYGDVLNYNILIFIFSRDSIQLHLGWNHFDSFIGSNKIGWCLSLQETIVVLGLCCPVRSKNLTLSELKLCTSISIDKSRTCLVLHIEITTVNIGDSHITSETKLSACGKFLILGNCGNIGHHHKLLACDSTDVSIFYSNSLNRCLSAQCNWTLIKS